MSAGREAVATPVATPVEHELAAPSVSPSDLLRITSHEHSDPHAVLGAHHATVRGTPGVVVRAWHPEASECVCLLADGTVLPLKVGAPGMFSAFIAGAGLPLRYRLRFTFPNGTSWERDDPYRFLPTIGEVDLHLFNEGTHRRLWESMGANIRTVDGVRGVSFSVWAPNARRVSLIGDFNHWDGRLYPMRVLGSSGVWELFVPEIGAGALYKFEILTQDHAIRVKTDPFAKKMEQAPSSASIVVDTGTYSWHDAPWVEARASTDRYAQPMAIYEVHLGSWARVPEDGHRSLSYREIAPKLIAHATRFGFTHVELMPIAEFPFEGSWGYQVSGYYAPTSRYGAPDDFRFFVDEMHRAGIGVILDWVPAHFPRDDFALRRFDGTALFEHEDPRLGEHPDWGTLIFNYGRNEVRNFLVANALYWMSEFHVDGLRVDAVASMLYLDYSRQPGEWLRNRYGGRENLEAIEFLRVLNETVRNERPGCFTVAEESTSWGGVTKPANEGGLGFTFKWNMGWMHDTLGYFSRDPIHRRFHQNDLTFAMLYEYTEHFIMPISHDEVVHLKGSLLEKMPGDYWQKLANLRTMLAYQYTRPGKKLLFMGTELATWNEWNHNTSLDWHLGEEPERKGFGLFLERLGKLYRELPALWRRDHSPDGFSWIDVADHENSVLSYVRRNGADHVVVVLNLTPVPRDDYRIGAPERGVYKLALNSDAADFGGSGYETHERVHTDDAPFHGYGQSMRLKLPPLGAIVLVPERGRTIR